MRGSGATNTGSRPHRPLGIVERSAGKETYMLGGQGVARIHFPDKKGSFAFGGSYFDYENAKGFPGFRGVILTQAAVLLYA